MWHLRYIFVSGPYMPGTCEVDIVVGFVLAHMCKNVWSLCPYSIMTVWLLFAMWQPYFLSNIKSVYSDMGVDW